jgi:hypothetical protein
MVRERTYIPVTLRVTPKRFALLNKESSQAQDMRHKQSISDGDQPVILVDSRIMPEEVGLSRLSRLLNLADKNEALTILVGSSVRRGSYPTINKSYQLLGTHLVAITTICVQKLVRNSYFGLFDFAALFVYKNSDLLSSVNSKLLIQTKMFFNETFFNVNRSKTISHRSHYYPSKSYKTKSDKTKSDKTKSDKTKSDTKLINLLNLKIKSDTKLINLKIKSDKIKSDKIKSDKIKWDKIKSDRIKSDKTKLNRIKLN